jgi:hypothetical protein
MRGALAFQLAAMFIGVTELKALMKGGDLAKGVAQKVAGRVSNEIGETEIISVMGGHKPGTFLLREIDHKPLGNVSTPGKSGSIAQSLDVKSEVLIIFGREGKKGDILLQSTVGDIRAAGFDVINAPTNNNPFHVRIVSATRDFDAEETEWLNAAFQRMGKIKR